MADVESNLDKIASDIDDLIASINFEMPGVNGSLANDLIDIAARGIIDRTVAEQDDAAGSPLKPNNPKYAAFKAAKYSSHQPLVRTGQMLSLASVRGVPTIGEDEIIMDYGLGVAPTSGSTGYISKADRSVTDRQKAGHVSEDRPFYSLDDAIAADMIDHAGKVIVDHLGKS